ncbi:MAG: DUF1080 domain-containing protein [Verrucomicrobiota bacterium]
MKPQIAVFIAGIFLAFSSWAQDSTDVDPRFAKLIEEFEAESAEKVDGAFETKLGQLNGQLDLALEREEQKAIKAGNLDLVTAIRAERKSLADNNAISDGDGENLPAKLNQFREAWRTQKGKLDEDRRAAANSAAAGFHKKLQELETALTKESKIEEALAVRSYREKFVAGRGVATPSAAADNTWITIMDGKSLSGWRASNPGAFQVVEKGIKAEKTGPSGRGYLFYTGEGTTPVEFKSFEIKIRLHAFRVGNANSGLFYHVPKSSAANLEPGDGLEINIANSNQLMNQTGAIWDIKPVKKPLLNQKESHELIIRITDDEILVTADGNEIMKHDPSSGSKKAYKPEGGAIALQANSEGACYVFEKIEIRKLD